MALGTHMGLKIPDRMTDDIKDSLKSFDPPSNPRTERIATAICYNKKCADYRQERDKDNPCECKKSRTPIKGAGSTPGWY